MLFFKTQWVQIPTGRVFLFHFIQLHFHELLGKTFILYSLAARKLKYKNWFQPIVLFQEYCVLLIRHACIMYYLISKPSLKIGSVKKTFLFFKIEIWNFQHLFETEIHETWQNFNSFSLFRQLLFSFFLSVVCLSWNFVRFHDFFFQFQLSILKNKKSFIPKKNII